MIIILAVVAVVCVVVLVLVVVVAVVVVDFVASLLLYLLSGSAFLFLPVLRAQGLELLCASPFQKPVFSFGVFVISSLHQKARLFSKGVP